MEKNVSLYYFMHVQTLYRGGDGSVDDNVMIVQCLLNIQSIHHMQSNKDLNKYISECLTFLFLFIAA